MALFSAAGAIVAGAVGARALPAQDRTRGEGFMATPRGRQLASVRAREALTITARRKGFVKATLEGWVARSALGPARDSFPVTAAAPHGAYLRAAARSDARVVAGLHPGMGLAVVARRAEWVHVRRTGWLRATDRGPIAAGKLQPAPAHRRLTAASHTRGEAPKHRTRSEATAAGDIRAQPYRPPRAPAASGVSAAPTPAAAPLMEPPLTPSHAVTLTLAPDGAAVASLDRGARLRVLARERGWVRVRVDGWVKEGELAPADSTLIAPLLSSADLRADSGAARGKVVRWEVQVLGLRVADALRKGLTAREPYLLVRGPGGDDAIVYVAVPPALLPGARALPPLARVLISARVRTARSEPAGTPVLEMLTLTRL
ncbi:MAG: hypothetical protein NVS9B3_08640 [Gemmatimonadaceae bacterium]